MNSEKIFSDLSKPVADVRTTVSSATEDSSIDIMVGFNKPVFGFESSMVDVEGGRVARQVDICFLSTLNTS